MSLSFLGKVSLQVLCPFFNWVVCLPGVESYEFLIYFGDQTLVQGIIGKYILLYSRFPFILLMFSLAVQKLLILMKSHLFISFMSLALGDISVKILLHKIYQIFLPMFSPRIFMVSCLTFKSLIYFQFSLVCGIRRWSSFIFLHIYV